MSINVTVAKTRNEIFNRKMSHGGIKLKRLSTNTNNVYNLLKKKGEKCRFH